MTSLPWLQALDLVSPLPPVGTVIPHTKNDLEIRAWSSFSQLLIIQLTIVDRGGGFGLPASVMFFNPSSSNQLVYASLTEALNGCEDRKLVITLPSEVKQLTLDKSANHKNAGK